ncbi:hypothetical protein Pmani_030145 [Petrolisthes manimaculis]|uniref:Torsin-1A C-terminal domain-containing protein n=1 Tax=Petrolisthes manimaculis TaxID=1843537 RepID=A0AAE1NW56_9EUCA|nr:hypothetical protein Pmani_030145 [Petrolisthes manimaculis]
MEVHEASTSRSPSRHKPLRRSLSAQPEESTLSSSPYSTRKRSGLPGRSLTQYFTHSLDRSDRAGSDDSQVTQRRTSVTQSSKGVLQLMPLPEDSRLLPSSSGLSEMEFDSPVRQVYSDYERRTVVYSVGNGNSSSGPVFTTVCDEKLTTRTLNNDNDDNDDDDDDDDNNGTGVTVRRRKYPDSSNRVSDKENKPKRFKMLRKICKMIILFIFLFFSFMFLGVGTSKLLIYREAVCNERRNTVLPIQELNNKLSEQVVGQELAIGLMVESIKVFVSSESVDPLLLWLVGSTGTGKTLTTSIIQNVLSNFTHVEVVVSSLLPLDRESLHVDSNRLLYNLDSCAINLVIIDGWDDKSNIPLTFLQNIMNGYRKNSDNGHRKWRLVLILSGTRGSEEVNKIYLDLHTNRLTSREEMQKYGLARLSTGMLVTEAAPLSTITKQYTLVPFLPLDVSAVQMCIRRELLKQRRTDVILDERKLRKISEDVVSHLEFMPSSSPVYSVKGCKRVQSLLALLLPNPHTPL